MWKIKNQEARDIRRNLIAPPLFPPFRRRVRNSQVNFRENFSFTGDTQGKLEYTVIYFAKASTLYAVKVIRSFRVI